MRSDEKDHGSYVRKVSDDTWRCAPELLAENEKLRLLHLMSDLGLRYVNVGLPGAGPHVVKTVTRLVEEIRDAGLDIEPNCAARTVVADIQPVADIQQKTGVPIANIFIHDVSPMKAKRMLTARQPELPPNDR